MILKEEFKMLAIRIESLENQMRLTYDLEKKGKYIQQIKINHIKINHILDEYSLGACRPVKQRTFL